MSNFFGGYLGAGTIVNDVFVECSASDYQRQAITFGALSAIGTTAAGQVTFTTTTAGWGAISAVALFANQTGGTNLIFWPLAASAVISSGQFLTVGVPDLTLNFPALTTAAQATIVQWSAGQFVGVTSNTTSILAGSANVVNLGVLLAIVTPGAALQSMLAAGEYLTTTPTLTNGGVLPLQLDASGNLKVNVEVGGGGGGSGGTVTVSNPPAQVSQGSTVASPTGMVAMGKNPSSVINALSLDGSGNLNVNVAAGGGSSTVTLASGGTVALTGTSAVTVANSPTVTVGGGTLSIGNSPTVSVSGGTVTLSGTPPVSFAALGSVAGGTAGASSDLAGGVYVASAPTLTNGQQAALALDASGNLKVNIIAGGSGGGTVTLASGGTVAIGNTPAVTVSSGTVTLSGSPTVTATGTVATTQSGTWTMQPGNTANTTPWLATINQGGTSAAVTAANALKVDNSAVTQPVSGTVTLSGTPAVSIGSTGTVVVGSGTVTLSGSPTVTTSGTVTALQGAAPWSENITQIGGAALTLGQKVMASSIPVAIASDDTVQVGGTVSLSGGVSISSVGILGNSILGTAQSTVNAPPFVQVFGNTPGGLGLMEVLERIALELKFLNFQFSEYAAQAVPAPQPDNFDFWRNDPANVIN